MRKGLREEPNFKEKELKNCLGKGPRKKSQVTDKLLRKDHKETFSTMSIIFVMAVDYLYQWIQLYCLLQENVLSI